MSITRNHSTEQYSEEIYKHGFIKAWKELWEEYDDKKDKWNKKSKIVCHLTRKNSLNLGECNDGSPFTSVNQAINVAKGLCNYDDEREIECLLRSVGFKNEDFFKYNTLKDLDRIEEKRKLYSNTCKKLDLKEEEPQYEYKTFISSIITSMSDKEIIKYFEQNPYHFKNVNIINRRKTKQKEAVWYMRVEEDYTVTYSFDKKVIRVRV